MKKVIAILFLVSACFINSSAQAGEYSSLVVKKVAHTKGMNYSFSFQIIHYMGGGIETDYTKTKDALKFDELIDVLNILSKAGWKVVTVTSDSNLSEDDVKTGLGGAKSTFYTHYLLYKG